ELRRLDPLAEEVLSLSTRATLVSKQLSTNGFRLFSSGYDFVFLLILGPPFRRGNGVDQQWETRFSTAFSVGSGYPGPSLRSTLTVLEATGPIVPSAWESLPKQPRSGKRPPI